MNRLVARLDVLIAGCTLPNTVDSDIRELLSRVERVHPGRQASALQASMARSDAIRGKIRCRMGRVAPWGRSMRRRSEHALLRMRGRDWYADRRTIADELRRMQTAGRGHDSALPNSRAAGSSSPGSQTRPLMEVAEDDLEKRYQITFDDRLGWTVVRKHDRHKNGRRPQLRLAHKK